MQVQLATKPKHDVSNSLDISLRKSVYYLLGFW